VTPTLTDFFEAYDAELNSRPGLRLGQTAFNTLTRVHPRLAEQVHGSACDPFYDDNRLPKFFQCLSSKWEIV